MKNNNEGPKRKFPNLKPDFTKLESLKEVHFTLYQEINSSANNKVYLQDQFIVGILKRSLDLLDGFISLINTWNYTLAGATLRMQIDSLLRIYYISQRKDVSMYMEFYNGKSFKDIKHTNGKKITDRILLDIAKPLYPWVEDIYKESSQFIHFSSKHFGATILSIDKEKRTIETFFGIGYQNWKEGDLKNLLHAFINSTDAVTKIVLGWIHSKRIMNSK